MLKKFFMTTILLGALIFNAAPNSAEAYDRYVGNSPATGWDCYVMTETISRSGSNGYYVTLKMITRNGNTRYLDYRFWYDYRIKGWRFSNDEGFSGIADSYETPIEWEVVRVINNY